MGNGNQSALSRASWQTWPRSVRVHGIRDGEDELPPAGAQICGVTGVTRATPLPQLRGRSGQG